MEALADKGHKQGEAEHIPQHCIKFLVSALFCYAAPMHLRLMHHPRKCTDKMASNS